jgi:site-specific recombinase XerD
VVAGSSPVSRSIVPEAATCLSVRSLKVQIARYCLDARALGYSEATISHTQRCVHSFAAFCGGISDVAAVGSDDLRKFIIYLKDKTARHNSHQGRKLSPISVNTYIRAVRSFWRWLEKTEAITSNPLADVPAPRCPRKLTKVYSEEQLKTLLRHVAGKPRERAIIELFLDSGIRLSELTGLTVNDVDLNQGSVKVLGKGEKERYSYFSPRTALSLRDYLDKCRPQSREGDYLFLTNDGFRLCNHGVQSLLRRLGRAAGLTTRLSPHRLRHSYATLCLRNGNNLEYVRITLGHTNIKTTSDAYLAASQ